SGAPALVVNTTGDGAGIAPGKIGLRSAIGLADIRTGPQTITFDSTVFATPKTITLTRNGVNPDLVPVKRLIPKAIQFNSTTATEPIPAPAAGLTVSGGGTHGVFVVPGPAIAAINGVTIRDGNAGTAAGVLVAANATLTLTNCTITANTTSDLGGGIGNNGT